MSNPVSICVPGRNKAVLSNTIGKLERRINELTDQMEEEHRIAAEQKDLVTHAHVMAPIMFILRSNNVLLLNFSALAPADGPENPLAQASAERGRGGGRQEGRSAPSLSTGTGRGEGSERAASEAAARPTPANKVCSRRARARTHTRTHIRNVTV